MTLTFKKIKQKRQLAGALLALALFPALFSSCAWYEKKRLSSRSSYSCHKEEGSARFRVNEIISHAGKKAISTYSEQGLIKTFTLNLKARLYESPPRTDVSIEEGAPFTVEYESSKGVKKQTRAMTNLEGYIQWQETYEYKYTARPVWIGLKRVIKGNPAYAGAQTIPLAVNPWLSLKQDKDAGMPSLLDTRCNFDGKNDALKDPKNYELDGLAYLAKNTEEEQPLLFAPIAQIQLKEINESQSNPKSCAEAEDPKSCMEAKGTESRNNPKSCAKAEYLKSCAEAEDPKSCVEAKRQLCYKQLLGEYKSCTGAKNEFCYKRAIQMEFYVPLKFRTKSVAGDVGDTNLLGGAYDAEAQIVISPKGSNKQNYRLTENKCVKKAIELAGQNSLQFTCKFKFLLFNQNAFYKLALRISPHKDPLFKPFEGIYTIKLDFNDDPFPYRIDPHDKDYAQALDGKKPLSIINNKSIKTIQDYLKEHNLSKKGHRHYVENGSIQGVDLHPLHLDGYAEYQLSHISKASQECGEKETAVQRTAVFVGKIFLKDVILQRDVTNKIPFRVFLEKPNENSVEEIFYKPNESGDGGEAFEMGPDGSISIPIELKHNIYDRQRYFQVDVHVLNEDENLYGKMRLALSPWQRAFQAFQDAQHLNTDSIRFDTTNVAKPELIINQFRRINLFPSYGLDKLLNIHLFHRTYLLFQPFIRRPDDLSLGRNYRSRELLRDGYYLVRVTVLRNPQETGDDGLFARGLTTKNMNKALSEQVAESRINLQNAQYITHTDSIVRAKANFINFYMPIHLSDRQFYYIASRNLIVIEIYPADPSGYEWKIENDECQVDVDTTTWRPFKRHELKNSPYFGAINLPNWFVWNLLQPVDVDTDELIKRSKRGEKYRHFTFNETKDMRQKAERQYLPSGANNPESGNGDKLDLNAGCSGEIYNHEKQRLLDIKNALEAYDKKYNHISANDKINPLNPDRPVWEQENPSPSEIQTCSQKAQKALTDRSQAPLDQITASAPDDLLKNFAGENSLRLIELFTDDGAQFAKDIKSSLQKYRSSYGDEKTDDISLLRDMTFLNKIPQIEDGEILKLKMIHICGIHRRLMGAERPKWNKCEEDILIAYLQNMKETLNGQDPLFALFDKIMDENLIPPEDQSDFKDNIKMCEGEQKHSPACHTAVKGYVSQALDNSTGETQRILGEAVLSLFSSDEKRLFIARLEASCPKDFISDGQEYKSCYFDQMNALYSEKNSYEPLPRLPNTRDAISQYLEAGNTWDWLLGRLFGKNKFTNDKIVRSMAKPEFSQKEIKHLIQTNAQKKNYDYSEDISSFDKFLSFAKSLCLFWLDFYLKDYLQKDQMISAYTNYIQKFDYYQILNDSAASQKYGKNLLYFAGLIYDLVDKDGEPLSKCYKKYAECQLTDHCQKRSINQTKTGMCSLVDNIEDRTCSRILEEECREDNSLSLCRDKRLRQPGEGVQLCNQEIRDFCVTNTDQPLCGKYGKYKNRCLAEYLPCLLEAEKNEPSLFNVNNTLNYKGKMSFPPLKTCLANPYEFFKFENKMMIHKLSKKNPKYKGGFLQNFIVGGGYNKDSYMNWTAQRGRSISIIGDGKLGADIDLFGLGLTRLFKAGGEAVSGKSGRGLLSMFSFKMGLSAGLGISQSKSSNESNSVRGAVGVRATESVLLTVGNAKFQLGVTKFQRCLTVKPRPNAFTARLSAGAPELYKDQEVWHNEAKDKNYKKIIASRPGLLLCGPVETKEERNAEKITESYYYISQNINADNAQFLNLYDLANRPFMLVLRGRKEFVKYYELMRQSMSGDNGNIKENGGWTNRPKNMFVNYPFPIEEAVGLSLTLREFNETGFYPGVYDYNYDSDEMIDAWFAKKADQSGLFNGFFTHKNVWDIPTPSKNSIPTSRW